MKKFSDLREEIKPDVTENNLDEALRSDNVQKLRQLAKLGIISDDHFPTLIRAFGKSSVDDLTYTEKDIIVRAFESMLHHIVDNKQVFNKIKTGLREEEEDGIEESYRAKEKGEFGFDPGHYEDEVHDSLHKQGFRRIGDGRYKHKDSGKEVIVAYHDGKASHAFVSEDISDSQHKDKKVSKAFPVLILLRRKAIRLFPDGKKVGLYFSDKLNRYISIPSTGDAVSEETILDEAISNPTPVGPNGENASDVISNLKGIVANRQPGHVRFRNGSKMKVDMLTAHALLTTYDRLTHPENKVHFDKHLNRDNPSFLKMVEFAHKHYLGNMDAAGMSNPGAKRPTPKSSSSSAASKTKKAAAKKSAKNK